jgi:tetratricopeptide (TPR) repeat protein
MAEQLSIIPIDLVEQVERGNCLLVAGPGVSIPPAGRLGPPGPALLALELAYRLGGQLEEYSLPWVSQYYADRNGLNSLREYVGGRLDDVRYRPTPVHHLIAQIPFKTVVYAAQDDLLREAYRRHSVQVNYVLHSEALAYGNGRTIIQLYGSAQDKASLRLTEDERRQVFAKDSRLGDYLVSEAVANSLLFVGFALNDPYFREFFFQLRPQDEANLPRAYLVQAEADPQDVSNYWRQRNASSLLLEADDLLQGVGQSLLERGLLAALNTDYEEPLPIDTAEQQRRQQIYLEFGRHLGLGGEVESGHQLQPFTSGLRLMRQVIAEHAMGIGAPDVIPQDQPDISRKEDNAQLQFQQGNIEWAEGNLDQARERFETSIEFDPNQSAAYLSLYYLLIETGEFEKALDFYQQLLERFPEQALLPDRYQIQKIAGQADLGITYVVTDAERNERVAATILRRPLSPESEALTRYINEVGKIQSSRISRLLECGRYHTRTYLITEFVEGEFLREHLNPDSLMALDAGLQIAEQIALALEDGHRQGVPHLNLEPENIILAPSGVRLVNYGFSRLARGANAAGRSGSRFVRDYASPEQRAGEAGDARSDVYALGTIIYEMLTGRTPGLGAYQQVSEIHAQAGEAVDLLIAHARDLDPTRRFQTSEELRMEIQRISLASRHGWLAQYLRLGLASISKAYTWLYSWPGILATLLVVILDVLAEVINVPLPAILHGALRFVGMAVVITPVCGELGYYMVREAARRQGLGSLIASGRGIGATLGLLLILHVYRITDFSNNSLGGITTDDFARFLFFYFLYVVAMTLVALGLILATAQTAKRLKSRYTLGFYYAYPTISGLLLLLALFSFPFGILTL